jgi:hypothetical protein
MIVNSEIAKRMDDSNSITACPRGEPRSDSGLEATVVMGCSKRIRQREFDKQMAGQGPPKTNKAGKTGLGSHQINRCWIVPQGHVLELKTP